MTTGNGRIIDYFAFAGEFPFGAPGKFGLEELAAEWEADGIGAGYVTDLAAVYQRAPVTSNRRFLATRRTHADVLWLLPVVDLSTGCFAREIAAYVHDFDIAGIRIAPNYHGYELNDTLCRRLLDVLAEHRLMLFVAKAVQDVRFQAPCLGVRALSLDGIRPLLAADSVVPVVCNGFTAAEIESAYPRLSGRVYFDVSAFDISFHSMEQLVEQRGTDRLVYGSHAPFLCPGAVLANLRGSFLQERDREAILEGIPV